MHGLGDGRKSSRQHPCGTSNTSALLRASRALPLASSRMRGRYRFKTRPLVQQQTRWQSVIEGKRVRHDPRWWATLGFTCPVAPQQALTSASVGVSRQWQERMRAAASRAARSSPSLSGTPRINSLSAAEWARRNCFCFCTAGRGRQIIQLCERLHRVCPVASRSS